jgi:hypothetical protein
VQTGRGYAPYEVDSRHHGSKARERRIDVAAHQGEPGTGREFRRFPSEKEMVQAFTLNSGSYKKSAKSLRLRKGRRGLVWQVDPIRDYHALFSRKPFGNK